MCLLLHETKWHAKDLDRTQYAKAFGLRLAHMGWAVYTLQRRSLSCLEHGRQGGSN
jgi:hypothetical protein